MWKNNSKKAPIGVFLGWILFLTIFVDMGLLMLLEPYAISYADNGRLTAGYVIYVVLGTFFSTPGPLVALFITLRKEEKITVKEYFLRIIHTPKPWTAVLITGFFCATAFVFALCCGKTNDAPWYMMPLGFMAMIPFVGIAEEPGWRGLLQPEMEKIFPFPIATSITAVIWGVWHLPLWIQPSSNHYDDSLIGFLITIFVWSFVSAAIYKATKSVFACAIYHAFIDSIGAIYDWNALFDAYPKTNAMLLYFGIVFVAAVIIWNIYDRREMRR